MTHAMTLEVSQDVYDLLTERAQELGRPAEVVAAELLTTASQYLISDPMESLIGTLEIDVHDWGERHDYYLGQALLAELRDERGEIASNNG